MINSSKADTLTEKKPIRLSYHTERLTKIATLDPVQITIVKYINFSDEDPPLFVGGKSPIKSHTPAPCAHISLT